MKENQEVEDTLSRSRHQIIMALNANVTHKMCLAAALKQGWNLTEKQTDPIARSLAHIGAISLEQMFTKLHSLFDHTNGWSLHRTTNHQKNGLTRSQETIELFRELSGSPHNEIRNSIRNLRNKISAHNDPDEALEKILDGHSPLISEADDFLDKVGEYVERLHNENTSQNGQNYNHQFCRAKLERDMALFFTRAISTVS